MSKKKLTVEQVLYCREHYKPGDEEYGIKAMAERLGVSRDALKDAVHGLTYTDVGGVIHPPLERVPQDVQEQIAQAYEPHSRDNNIRALAKRFGLSEGTIIKYAHLIKPRGRRSKVTDELKAAIQAEYQPYSPDFGRNALAEKYGLSSATVGKIIKEVQTEPRRRGRQATIISDEVKEAIIIANDEEHLSVKGLAERFGLSREVVKGVLTEAGVEMRTRQTVDEDTKQEIIGQFMAGRSLRELAEVYSVNRATISKWVEGLKASKPQRKELDQTTREQIYRYHSQGYGSTIIAKTVGLSQQIVRKVIDGEL